MGKAKKAALYLRVSTDGQATDNQRMAVEAVAEQRGWPAAAIYDDNGISGAKGRAKHSGLDKMLKDAGPRAVRCRHVLGDGPAGPIVGGPDRHVAYSGKRKRRFVPAPPGDRHHDAGRPNVSRKVETAVRARLAAGDGVLKAARAAGCGTSVAQRIKAEMALPRP